MKYFLNLLIGIAIFSLPPLNAQTNFSNKTFLIKNSSIVVKKKDNVDINYIKTNALKNGSNYQILKSGYKLFTNVRNNEIVSFSLRNSAGNSVGYIKRVMKRGLNYSCNGPFCICNGDADCNDMFTNGHCGTIQQCYIDANNHSICICVLAKK